MTLKAGSLAPNQVNVVPTPGIPGDFCSANPRYAMLAGPGGLVAGPGGVTAGNFCWTLPGWLDTDSGAQVVVSFGSGLVAGFVHREMQGVLLSPLTASSLNIPQGFMVTAMTAGDFWALNSGSTQCVSGMKAYANYQTGAVTFAATGAPLTATSTSYTISAQTFSVTGSITGNIMTVTAVGSGTVYTGAVISGTNVYTGTQVGPQITGTTGGIGTYYVTYGEQTVAAGTTISGTYGLFTAGGTITGTFGVGQTLTGTGVTAASYITALGTGTGGAGTYIVNLTQTASSGTITAATNVETSWIARSGGLAGEVVKIANLPALG
jgi:hypothetical protein